MALRINDAAFNQTFLYLQDSQKALSESINRLSSGKKITKAADDAAGMTISTALESQVRGLGQSIRDATDAIAVTQVADGALMQSADLVSTIREKAIQAANASQGLDSRKSLQSDIENALLALNDIVQNTSYNGQKLLSGQYSDKSFQIGTSPAETVTLNVNSAETKNLGSESGTLSDISVLSAKNAQDAVVIADAALADINAMRSGLGSTQNQLASTLNNLSITKVNVASADSGISDLDFAEESINFAKMQALNKARSFAFAQNGKINKQGMIDLLQG